MLNIETHAPTDARSIAMTRMKTRLLAEGLRVELRPALADTLRPAFRTRSGSCGGLDVILPDGTWVNCPVHERFARTSSLRLVDCDGSSSIVGDGVNVPVTLAPAPEYYGRRTTRGTSMRKVGQLCSDRVGVGITNLCTYWKSRERRCKFCSIGLNIGNEHARKDPLDVLETVLATLADPVAPARHVLLGGGTPDEHDAGATEIAQLATLIKSHSDVAIYAMVAPPRDLGYLDLLADAGVDEIGINIEVFSEQAARQFIPAKHAAAGVDGYWRALEYAVELFGPINTRSITVVGLEDRETTVRGVARLASMGVLPILSPLRRLDDTLLEHFDAPTADELWAVTVESAAAADAYEMPLGPICIACQSNTLNLPGDRRYRLY